MSCKCELKLIDRWLYRVILALDANFRLSNKLTHSTTETDPVLTDGRAYMAPWDDYADHIKKTDKELSEKASIFCIMVYTQSY